jgi:hypothetical protein
MILRTLLTNISGSHSRLGGQGWTAIGRLVSPKLGKDLLMSYGKFACMAEEHPPATELALPEFE